MREHRCSLVAAVAIIVASTFPTMASPRQNPGTFERHSFTNEAGTRDYMLYVPPRPEPGLPLVVFMHGAFQTAEQMAHDTRWNELAHAENFFVLYPEALVEEGGFFNYTDEQNQHRDRGVPLLLAGMTKQIISDWAIDPARVYAAGLSNGGAMANHMLPTYPDIFAALASHSGCPYKSNCGGGIGSSVPAEESARQIRLEMGSRARVVPFIVIQGADDGAIQPYLAERIIASWLQADDWADDGTDNGSIPRQPASIRQETVPGGRSFAVHTYLDANGCSLGEYWLVAGMRHAYSGGAPNVLPGVAIDLDSKRKVSPALTDPLGPDATAATYRFFMSHAMGGASAC